MPHVFISYVRNNRRRVQQLCDNLTKHGVKVWLDRNEIGGGSRWRQAIRRAIQDGAFFIACFSKEYNARQKTYMNEELTLAIDELRQRSTDQSWFIPVKVNKCEIPDRDIGAGETLRDLQYIELYKDWDAGIRQILDVIQPIPVLVSPTTVQLHSSNYSISTPILISNRSDIPLYDVYIKIAIQGEVTSESIEIKSDTQSTQLEGRVDSIIASADILRFNGIDSNGIESVFLRFHTILPRQDREIVISGASPINSSATIQFGSFQTEPAPVAQNRGRTAFRFSLPEDIKVKSIGMLLRRG